MISIAGLEESRKPNPAKVWSEFKEEFLQNFFKIIKCEIERYQVDDHQILKLLKNIISTKERSIRNSKSQKKISKIMQKIMKIKE